MSLAIRSLFNSVVVQLRWRGHNVHPCLLGWVPRLVADIVKDSTTPHVVGRNEGVVVSRGILGTEPYSHRLMESSRCRKEAVLVKGSTRGKVEASQSVLQWVLNSGDRNPENITSNEVIVCTVETSNSTVKYNQAYSLVRLRYTNLLGGGNRYFISGFKCSNPGLHHYTSINNLLEGFRPRFRGLAHFSGSTSTV